jgi:hypothetical protein
MISYVWSTSADDDDAVLLGFIEPISEGRWRACGARYSPSGSRIWTYDLGSFPTPERARGAIRINALLPGKE